MAARLGSCVFNTGTRRLQTCVGLVRTTPVCSISRCSRNVAKARMLSSFSAVRSRTYGSAQPWTLISKRYCSATTSEQQNVDIKTDEEVAAQPKSKPFAVVHIGGGQFKVEPEDELVVARLTANIGERIYLEKVLLARSEKCTLLGNPILNSSLVRVKATVVRQGQQGVKDMFKKYRRRQLKKRKSSNRLVTTLRIDSIELKPTLS